MSFLRQASWLVGLFCWLSLASAQAAAPAGGPQSDSGKGVLPDGIRITTHVSTLSPTLRAPFLVTLTVIDQARSLISLKLHRPHGEAIDGRRIAISMGKVTIDGRLANRRVYRWAISALKPGEIKLAFAHMTLQVTGSPNKDWHWTPQSRTLNVQPLPAYLPEYLPVTQQLTVEQHPLPKLQAGQLVDWLWTVRGRGVTERWLRTVLDQQLVSTPRLHFGTPEIRTIEASDKQKADDPLAQTFEVRVPLLPDPDPEASSPTSGPVTLPAIRLPYVRIAANKDRRKAELAAVTLPARQLKWVSPPPAGLSWSALWRYLPLLLAAVALLWLSWLVGRDVHRRLDARRRHARARERVAAARTPAELLAVLRAVSGCETLGAMGRDAPNPNFLVALQALDRACYGGSVDDFEALRAELVRWLPRSFVRQR